MNKKTLKKLKQNLEKEKERTEKMLEGFAKKDEGVPGDWDTRFPSWDGQESGGAALEKAADQVEEYSTLLPIEHNLESRLKNINSALEKIKKRGYGICEKCKKPINLKRLEISPEAKLCQKCKE